MSSTDSVFAGIQSDVVEPPQLPQTPIEHAAPGRKPRQSGFKAQAAAEAFAGFRQARLDSRVAPR